MVSRPLPIKLYLALQGRDRAPDTAPGYATVPKGIVIWAICGDADHANQAGIIETALRADGDVITIVATCPDGSGPFPVTPLGKRQVAAFLDHFKPQMILWIGAQFDPLTLDLAASGAIPSFAIAATPQMTQTCDRAGVPRLTRAVLGMIERLITIDQDGARRLAAKGATDTQLMALGPLQATPATLPHHETERQDLARALGTRPIWLVAAAHPNEVEIIAAAHRQASRRAHRLLLIVATADPEDAAPMAQAFRDAGFHVHTRADDTEPVDTTQVFVVDGTDELGLWYRIAPVTFLAGTLRKGSPRHPFEAAALGSAVLHGPYVAPYEQQAAMLAQKGGSLPVADAKTLGEAVETLLSADKVAQMAHAAWDVTTQGADVAQKIAAMIQTRLDQAGVGHA